MFYEDTEDDSEGFGEAAYERVQCPWCWQFMDIFVESDLHGEWVQDCEVCCRPWVIRVNRTEGEKWISVDRGNQ